MLICLTITRGSRRNNVPEGEEARTENEVSSMSDNADKRVRVMKNPAHPGRLIKSELDELGVSVSEAAEKLGVTRSQLYRVINGESAVSAEMAYRLEKAIGSTADFWLRLQGKYDLARIRARAASIKVDKLAPKVA
jgi:addiction module HigA family antidote